MKKLTVLVLALLMTVLVQANEQIDFSTSIINEKSVTNGVPKSPMQPPTVYIEDYTLSFSIGHPDYTLNIVDEDGDVVFTTSVFSTETQVTLPSALSGEYQIEIVMGYWKFTGYIEL